MTFLVDVDSVDSTDKKMFGGEKILVMFMINGIGNPKSAKTSTSSRLQKSGA